MPKLKLPDVEMIINEAITNVIGKHQKNGLRELLISKNFSDVINEIEEEANRIYRIYERKAIERYLRDKSLTTKDVLTAINAIIDNSLITSIANIRKARAGSSVQTILVKALSALGIKCEVARYEYKGYRPDIIVPSNKMLERGVEHVFVLAVKRTLRERWAEDIDVFKFPNSAFVLIKPDPDFTPEKARDMVRRGMKNVYIPDILYDKLKDVLRKEHGTIFKPLSQLPKDLDSFLKYAYYWQDEKGDA